jgi:NADH-quinone oxidoreductase subunit M
LPGTSGFVGEFLTLLGTFKVSVPVATLATLGVILSACYALWLYRKMIFGKLEKPKLQSIKDMDAREIGIFVPLVALTLLFGFWPKPVLDMSSASVNALVAQYQTATGKTKKAEAETRIAGEKPGNKQ